MRHGSAVAVEYVELQDVDTQREFADILRTIEEQDLPYPLVAINGELRLAGSAEYFQVLPLVEEALSNGRLR